MVIGIFALPFLIALGLYSFEWRPASTTNHGQLMEPPRLLPASGLVTPEGRRLADGELRGKWLLVQVGAGVCEAICQQALQQARQVHVALNKEMGRVRRVWLSTEAVWAAAPERLGALQGRYPDLLVAAPAPGDEGEGWRDAFSPVPAGTLTPGLYIADPAGNLMMHYPESFSSEGLFRDLERLLRYSWLG